LALVLPDESSRAAEKFLNEIVAGSVVALTALHWPLEVANGLLQASRRKRISVADRLIACDFVIGLPVTVVDDQPTVPDLFSLSDRDHLSVYDACYLALALRRGALVATSDGPLRRAAQRQGVLWSAAA